MTQLIIAEGENGQISNETEQPCLFPLSQGNSKYYSLACADVNKLRLDFSLFQDPRYWRKVVQQKEMLSPIFPAVTPPFPKSRASYFRFARFNTPALYYLRAWHRLIFRVKLSLDYTHI